jgi:hypothetical protein
VLGPDGALRLLGNRVARAGCHLICLHRANTSNLTLKDTINTRTVNANLMTDTGKINNLTDQQLQNKVDETQRGSDKSEDFQIFGVVSTFGDERIGRNRTGF